MNLGNSKFIVTKDGTKFIGQLTANGELTGDCIQFSQPDIIHIGSFKNGKISAGNYIRAIQKGEILEVGSYSLDENGNLQKSYKRFAKGIVQDRLETRSLI